MTEHINDAAKARREGSRKKGKFGEQNLVDPGNNIGLTAPKATAMDEDTFDNTFTRVQSPSGSDVWGSMELDNACIAPDRVWTVIDGDDDTAHLMPGVHPVNGYGYMVTEEPWTDPDITVNLENPSNHEAFSPAESHVSAETMAILEAQPIMVLGDQPAECPLCGARTGFDELPDGRQLHECPRCSNLFLAEQPDPDDDLYNDEEEDEDQ